MAMVQDAGEDASALDQRMDPHRLEKTSEEELADKRRAAALADVEPGLHSRHAVLKRKVRSLKLRDLTAHSTPAQCERRASDKHRAAALADVEPNCLRDTPCSSAGHVGWTSPLVLVSGCD